MDAKQLVRDIFEMINTEDYSRVRELIHEDYVDHGSPLGEVHGPEGFLDAMQPLTSAFSEAHSETRGKTSAIWLPAVLPVQRKTNNPRLAHRRPRLAYGR